MDIHFIDTSIFTNILNVDKLNENRASVIAELKELYNKPSINALILPYATIIETGNHIAHISDGRLRRETAERFRMILTKTIQNEAPWNYYGKQMTIEDIKIMCEEFPDMAMRGEGFGDLSIIQAYKRFKEETPAIRRIRIWSLDIHMRVYDEILPGIGTRN